MRFRATGASMGRAIPPGSVITAVPLDPAAAAVGEVLVHMREGRLWIHRLARVAIQEGHPPRFVCHGDGQTHDDPPVEARDVLARVVAIEPSVMGWLEVRAPAPVATVLRVARRILHAALDAR